MSATVAQADSAKVHEPIAVYVHIPWCAHRCDYCDFTTATVPTVPRARYEAALLAELGWRLDALQRAGQAGRVVRSVFFGGGTPTLQGTSTVRAVLERLRASLRVSADVEVTVEANPKLPGDVTLAGLAEAGVTRISLGVQSLDDARLQLLDRNHGAREARRTMAELRALIDAGELRSASVDLMYGGHGQTLEALLADVSAMLEVGLPHLSTYALTVEPGTVLQRRIARGQRTAPDEDLQAAMFEAIGEAASAAGMTHYEVSNHARPGHASAHNENYWHGGAYLAIGTGAHGYLPWPEHDAAGDPAPLGVRYANDGHVTRWLRAVEAMAGEPTPGPIEAFREPVTSGRLLTERLLTGLRTARGVDTAGWTFLVDDERRALLGRADAAAGLGVVRRGARLSVAPARWFALDRAVLALMPDT